MNDFVNYMPITIVMIIALISLMVQPLYKAVIKFIAAPIVGAVYVLYIGITTAMEQSAAQAVPHPSVILLCFAPKGHLPAASMSDNPDTNLHP